jgi:hypothetical protein
VNSDGQPKIVADVDIAVRQTLPRKGVKDVSSNQRSRLDDGAFAGRCAQQVNLGARFLAFD